MSLMSTLAKVAVGVAVAKGVGHMMKKPGNPTGSAGAGGLFGGQESAAQQASGGGLEDLVGSVLGGGGRSAASGGAPGGLGGLLEKLSGAGGRAGGTGSGLNDILGSLSGGGSAGGASGGLGGLLGAIGGGGSGGSGGGLGGLLSSLGGAGGGAAAGGLGGLLGALSGGDSGSSKGSFGEVLNSAFPQTDTPEIPPSAEQEVAAALMLRAMIQAAKSDGKLDDAERDKLLGKLGDVSQEEMDFVQGELQAPLDVDGLAGQVPSGLEAQVYAMSVMAIDLDSQAEAQYLDHFAKALNLHAKVVNDIHGQLGVPALYA